MDNPIKDGGLAFPSKFEVLAGNMDPIKGRVVDTTQVYISTGMTLRDWFAGQALAGLIGSIDAEDAKNFKALGREASALIWARDSYYVADAMLAAREAKK